MRLRVRMERVDGKTSVEVVGVANSGFVGLEPEVLVPMRIANELKLSELGEPEVHTKIAGDGRELELLRYRGAVRVYVVTEDRVEGPVVSDVLVAPRARYVLLNDKLLSKLRIVLLDFGEGIWCFRDELGKKERRSV